MTPMEWTWLALAAVFAIALYSDIILDAQHRSIMRRIDRLEKIASTRPDEFKPCASCGTPQTCRAQRWCGATLFR